LPAQEFKPIDLLQIKKKLAENKVSPIIELHIPTNKNFIKNRAIQLSYQDFKIKLTADFSEETLSRLLKVIKGAGDVSE
jgi:hypothetical protein